MINFIQKVREFDRQVIEANSPDQQNKLYGTKSVALSLNGVFDNSNTCPNLSHSVSVMSQASNPESLSATASQALLPQSSKSDENSQSRESTVSTFVGTNSNNLPTQGQGFGLNADSFSHPVLVHCSAGIGRTGTYIVIDQIMHQYDLANSQGLEEPYLRLSLQNNQIITDPVNEDIVYKVSLKVRQQRAMAIQTLDQYKFCYLASKEYILSRWARREASSRQSDAVERRSSRRSSKREAGGGNEEHF